MIEATHRNDPPPAPPSWKRRALCWMLNAGAMGLAAMIAAGLVGQFVRDPVPASALLMYIPLPMVGAIALAVDLSCRGRAISRPRFVLAAMGAAAVAWSSATMLGTGGSEEPRPADREVIVLHENVLWGGGLFRSPQTWSDQRADLLARNPDLIVLSEAPPAEWIASLVHDLGTGASSVDVRNEPTSPYWYHLVVVSRWPIRLEGSFRFSGGAGMAVEARVDGRRIRLLVVDGMSRPTQSRLPFLGAVAATSREAELAGRPFDLILGDFNTPARSLGFDGLTGLGYRLAGRFAPGWRGTFPAWVPVYDIDHVWVGSRLRIRSDAFFQGPHSDHRGQVVHLLVPEESH